MEGKWRLIICYVGVDAWESVPGDYDLLLHRRDSTYMNPRRDVAWTAIVRDRSELRRLSNY